MIAARIVSLILVVIGACISYPAKKIAYKIKGEDATESDVLKIKITGLVIVIIATIIAIAERVIY